MKKLLFVFAAVMILAFTANAVIVDGYCYLENQTNHEGTKVLFQADSPGAVTDSTYTDYSGYYQIDLAMGAYDVFFNHQGYWDEEILDQLFFSNTTLPEVTLTQEPIGIEISGEQSGILVDTTYFVIGDIYVSNGDSLTIEAGATLIFNEDVQFDIDGYLHAAGTETDSVKFINSPDLTWGGIDFNSSSDDSSKLEYCLITGSNSSGLYLYSSSPTISHCTVSGNSASSYGGGLFLYNSSPTISNCTVQGNSAGDGGGGLYICWYSSPAISHCTVQGNSASSGGGLHIYWYSSPAISHCTVQGNSADWGGGLYIRDNSSPTIVNTIVEGNTGYYGVYFDSSPDASLTYSDFYNNENGNFYNPPQWVGQIVTVNANGDSCDLYMNIFEDPLFAEPELGDFHLQAGSPCIDAGDPESPPDPDGSIADIGAFPYDSTWVFVAKPEISLKPVEYALHTPYPNPFNPETHLTFDLPSPGHISLVIYDIQGREVAMLVDGFMMAGMYQRTFDGSELASGVYFASLKAEGFSQTRKLLLIK